jgi:hypothetical protein
MNDSEGFDWQLNEFEKWRFSMLKSFQNAFLVSLLGASALLFIGESTKHIFIIQGVLVAATLANIFLRRIGRLADRVFLFTLFCVCTTSLTLTG